MTKVKCNALGCLDNKDGICQAEEIDLSFVMVNRKVKVCSKRRYEQDKNFSKIGHYY